MAVGKMEIFRMEGGGAVDSADCLIKSLILVIFYLPIDNNDMFAE